MFQALEHLEQDSGMGRRKGHKWKGQKNSSRRIFTERNSASLRAVFHKN